MLFYILGGYYVAVAGIVYTTYSGQIGDIVEFVENKFFGGSTEKQD